MMTTRLAGITRQIANCTLVGFLSLWASSWANAFPVSAYGVTDLGLGISPVSSAAYINNLGQVVANKGNASGYITAILWDNGVTTDLGTLGGGRTYARGINDLGQITGISETTFGTPSTNGIFHSFLYDTTNGLRDITPNLNNTYADGINNAGQVVGKWQGQSQTFVWQESQGFTDVFGPTGLHQSPSINNLGTVAYFVTWQAYIWDAANGYRPLDGLGFAPVEDINDANQVIGRDIDAPQAAFIWDPASGVRYLFPSQVFPSYANAVNNFGQIVGIAGSNGSGPYIPYLWIDGAAYDLNSLIPDNLGWTLFEPFDINDLGQIVGTGMVNGERHGFLLTRNAGVPLPDPIAFPPPLPPPNGAPEPATFALLGLGLVGLAASRRRRLS